MRRLTDHAYLLVAWLAISALLLGFWALVALAMGAV